MPTNYPLSHVSFTWHLYWNIFFILAYFIQAFYINYKNTGFALSWRHDGARFPFHVYADSQNIRNKQSTVLLLLRVVVNMVKRSKMHYLRIDTKLSYFLSDIQVFI